MSPKLYESYNAVRQAGQAVEDAREKLAAIDAEAVELSHRIERAVEGEREAAGRAIVSGKGLDAKATAKRRSEIEAARERLEALRAANPLVAKTLREAESRLVEAREAVGAVAVPALNDWRVKEAEAVKATLAPLGDALARLYAVDMVQDAIAGQQPFVRVLPPGLFFGRPLVEKMIAAIPARFAERAIDIATIKEVARKLSDAKMVELEKVNA